MLRPRIREVCERCRGRLHPALMRIFILENLSRIEELAKAYAPACRRLDNKSAMRRT